jgi:SAM-dependent methyltransferase
MTEAGDPSMTAAGRRSSVAGTPPLGGGRLPTPFFDALAPTYDLDFTSTALGRALRERVWERLAALFPPGANVLELACGTGEDARFLAARGVRVVATDQSEPMLALARHKTADLPVTLIPFDLTGPPPPEVLARAPYAGLFSNFGGLNTLSSAALAALAAHLASLLTPGARVLLVVMGRWCAWEIGWHLIHLQPRRAFRRLVTKGAPATPSPAAVSRGTAVSGIEPQVPYAYSGQEDAGPPLLIHYPSTSALRRAFAPAFRLARVWPLGLFLPPTALERLTRRSWFPFRLLAALDRLPWPLLADHTVYELVRQG